MIYELYKEFIKKNKVNFTLFILTFIYIPISKLALPHIYGKFISNIKSKNLTRNKQLLIYLVLLWSFIQGLKLISNYFENKIMPQFHNTVRNFILNKVLTKYENNYEELKIGDIISKVMGSPHVFTDVFWLFKDFVFRNIIIVVSAFFYLFKQNKSLSLVFLGCMSLIFIISYLFNKNCKSSVVNLTKVNDEIHEEIADTISNVMSIYVSKKKDEELNRFNKLGNNLVKKHQDVRGCYRKFKLIYTIIFIGIFIVLNYYTLYLYNKKKINASSIISIFIINYSILTDFMIIYDNTKEYLYLDANLGFLVKYLENLKTNNKLNNERINKNEKLIITAKNLNYSIGDKRILSNINFDFNKYSSNEKMLVMGHIGSGKSSLAKILVKLYSTYEGSIKINNQELRNINIKDLRNYINYIPQNPKLFNRTLFENITYGNQKATKKDINNILDKLDINDLKIKFNKLMEETVGKEGSKLSGGQKQIVFLLRAILMNSSMLIIDEPSASLDDASKEKLINFFNTYFKNKALIIISHDDNFKKICNKMIKLENGKVKQIVML